MIEARTYSPEKTFVMGSSQTKEKLTRRQILTPKIKAIIDEAFSERLGEEKWPDKRIDILYFLNKEEDISIKEDWGILSERIKEKLRILKGFSKGVQSEVIKGYTNFEYACDHPNGESRRDENRYVVLKSQGEETPRRSGWLREEEFEGEPDFDEDFSEEKETLPEKRVHEEIPKYLVKLPENNPNFTEINYLELDSKLRDFIVNSMNVRTITKLHSLWGEELLSKSPNFTPKQLAKIYEKIGNFHKMISDFKRENPNKDVVFPFTKSPEKETVNIKNTNKPTTEIPLKRRIARGVKALKQEPEKFVEEEKKELKLKVRRKLPVILEPKEVQNLLKQPNKRYPTGLRNKAVMALMLHCGLRISEVVNLTPESINLAKGKLRVESEERIKGRNLAIPEYLTDLLDSWDKKRPDSSFFFSTLKGKKLSIRYLQQMVGRYAQRAGINKMVSPHTLRHTYATQYYRQTKDIEALRKILGHSDISTTTIYIALANTDVEKSMKSFRGFL